MNLFHLPVTPGLLVVVVAKGARPPLCHPDRKHLCVFAPLIRPWFLLLPFEIDVLSLLLLVDLRAPPCHILQYDVMWHEDAHAFRLIAA